MSNLSDEQVKIILLEAESRLATRDPILPPERSLSSVPNTSKISMPPKRQHHNVTIRGLRPQHNQAVEDNAGPGWFRIPKTDTSDSTTKSHLQVLHMRTVLDPKRHYKKESLKAQMPKYSHVGTIIEGATDARLSRKERKQTLVEELLATEQAAGKFKSKYQDIQQRKSSGKRAFYRKLVLRRRHRN